MFSPRWCLIFEAPSSGLKAHRVKSARGAAIR